MAQRLADLESELNALKAQSQAIPETRPIQPASFQNPYPAENGYYIVGQPDEPAYPTLIGSGFIHLDWGNFSQDAASTAAVGDVQDGIQFSRARVSVAGEAWEDVSYILEMDFGLFDRPTFVDLFLDIDTHTALGHLRVGRWRHPFSMDSLTSIRELTFLERATLFAFGPFRQTGLGFYVTLTTK